MAKIKIKAKESKGVIKVRALLSHVMETGLRKDKKGQIIPRDYITDLVLTHNGKQVATADIGPSISKNPYFAFYVTGVKGDTIELSFTDNKGKTESASVVSK